MKEETYRLKKLASVDIAKALDDIEKALSTSSRFNNTFINIRTEINRLKINEINGTLSYTEISIETNKLLLRTLKLIDLLYEEKLIDVIEKTNFELIKKHNQNSSVNIETEYRKQWDTTYRDLINFIDIFFKKLLAFQDIDNSLHDFIHNRKKASKQLKVSDKEYFDILLDRTIAESNKLEKEIKDHISEFYPKFNTCFQLLEEGLLFLQNKPTSISFWDKIGFYYWYKHNIRVLYKHIETSIPAIKEIEAANIDLENNFKNRKGHETEIKIKNLNGEEKYVQYYNKKITIYKLSEEFGRAYYYMLSIYKPLAIRAEILFKEKKI